MSDFKSDFEKFSKEAAVEQRPANYAQRILAAIIDFLIATAISIVPTVMFFWGLVNAGEASDKGQDTTGGTITLIVLGFVSGLAAVIWVVWIFGYRQGITGKTPGKRTAGIRLTRIDTGEPPGGGVGVGRVLVPWLINSFTAGVYVIIDYLWPLWDDHKQRVSDKMFSTQVAVDDSTATPTQVVVDDSTATPTQYNPIS